MMAGVALSDRVALATCGGDLNLKSYPIRFHSSVAPGIFL